MCIVVSILKHDSMQRLFWFNKLQQRSFVLAQSASLVLFDIGVNPAVVVYWNFYFKSFSSTMTSHSSIFHAYGVIELHWRSPTTKTACVSLYRIAKIQLNLKLVCFSSTNIYNPTKTVSRYYLVEKLYA